MDTLREKVIDLRSEERALVETEVTTAERLAVVRAELARTKGMLLAEGRTEMRVASVASGESARGTIARLGTFTMDEAETELGWDRKRLKGLLDAMACEVPPTVVPAGRLGSTRLYRYAGAPIEEADPLAERDAAALEALREWVLGRDRAFTPAQAAAAIEVPRATALRALRSLQELDIVMDDGPTPDMPLFVRVGDDVPDLAVHPPVLAAVTREKVTSKIPVIQELLVAAYAASCDVTESNGHYGIESLSGERVIIASKPQGRQQLLEEKAKLRRIGVAV